MTNLIVAGAADMQATEVLDSDVPNDLDWLIGRLEKIRSEFGGKLKVACTAGYESPENEAIHAKHIRVVDDGSASAYEIEGPFLLIGGPGY